jgi:predicted transcriptional regulator
MSIELAFSEKILRKLDELARQQDALPEEIVTEAVLDPPPARGS